MYSRGNSGKRSRAGSKQGSRKGGSRLYSKNKEKKFRTLQEELTQLKNQNALIRKKEN
jgi:hypothetical protein